MSQKIFETWIIYIGFALALISWARFKMSGKHSVHGCFAPFQLKLTLFIQTTSTILCLYAGIVELKNGESQTAILNLVFGMVTGIFAWQVWRCMNPKA